MPIPRHVSVDISAHLDAIGRHFKNPQVTLFVRNPDVTDGDLFVSNDKPELVIAAIERVTRTGHVQPAGSGRMKNLFPKGVEVRLGVSPAESFITDVATGDDVGFIRGIEVKVDANDLRVPTIVLTMCAMAVKISGVAEYRVDVDALERIAADHGYKLVPIVEGA